MGFIKGFECRHCGSSLGKWVRGFEFQASYCFLCNATRAGRISLMAHEVDGLEPEEVRKLVGVEPGTNGATILRLHSETATLAWTKNQPFLSLESGPQMYTEISLRHGSSVIQFPLGDAVSKQDIIDVTKVLERMIKENKNASEGIPSSKGHCTTCRNGCSAKNGVHKRRSNGPV